jgi:SagB-type dehydrogenase family enzyme
MNTFKDILPTLPVMGVGYGFNFDLPLTPEGVSKLQLGDLGGFAYIEIQPPHVLLFNGMWRILEVAPTIIHCSQFSLGSPRPREDTRFFRLTKEVMMRAKTPWFAEHISLSHFPGGDTRHFFLPHLNESIFDDIVRNADILQRQMGFPMLLENAPRFFDVSDKPVDEGTFIRNVVDACQCGYLLDLSSARKTSSWLGYDLDEYIEKMPLEVLVELHVGDIVVERELALDLIRECPVKAVTLEANLSKAGPGELQSFVSTVNNALRRTNATIRVSSSSTLVVEDSSGRSLPDIDFTNPIRFSGGTSITLYSDHIAVHSPGSKTTLIPRAAAGIVADMLRGKSLEALIDPTDPDIAVALELSSNHASDIDAKKSPAWTTWGLAEAYHQSLRATARTIFEGKEQFEARLSTPESQSKRPAFAKEYPMHPYFKLPKPGKMHSDALSVALLQRRTCRAFKSAQISLQTIANILYYSCGWTASGVQRVGGMPIIRRTSPSPGSMASIEAYLIALDVVSLVPGIYHYSLVNHGLELLDGENPKNWIDSACGDQTWVAGCSAAILLSGVSSRLAWKYPMPKGYQVMIMEVGHISQSALLCATAEGIHCFCTAALRQEIFESRIELSPLEETPLLVIGLGHAEELGRGGDL